MKIMILISRLDIETGQIGNQVNDSEEIAMTLKLLQ
jgi:hypothetical protein